MRSILVPILIAAGSACAQDASLRLGGKDVPLAPEVQARLRSLAREMFGRCGPNTLQHPGNFGLAALGTEKRWASVLEGSRLRIRFAEPFVTTSHLGGTLGVSEAVIGLEQHGRAIARPAPGSSATAGDASSCRPRISRRHAADLSPHQPFCRP